MGGYIMLDLQDINIEVGGQAVHISGIYETLEGNYRKPVVVTNLTMGGVERPARWVNFGNDGTSFIGFIAVSPDWVHLHITITDGDMVSITEN